MNGAPREELKRTNVRLPRELHAALKSQASLRNTTIEEIVTNAVRRELKVDVEPRQLSPLADERDRTALRQLSSTLENCLAIVHRLVSPKIDIDPAFLFRLAIRFVESLPTEILIATSTGQEYWCNTQCSRTFSGEIRAQMAKRDHEEIGQTAAVDEGLLTEEVGDKEKRSFSLHRFAFEASEKKYLGRVLFSTEEYEVARRSEILKPLHHVPFSEDSGDEEIRTVLASFLEQLPTAAVVKDREGKLLWANGTYLSIVARKALSEIAGFRTSEIVEVAEGTLEKHEELVRQQKTGLLACEVVNHIQRRTLRFPILDSEGDIEFLAAIGTERIAAFVPVSKEHRNRE
jgi:PAS domain-containing protein